MSGIYFYILIVCLLIALVKIIHIWVKQLFTLFISKLPCPGIPLPIVGHSYHFFGLQPEDFIEIATKLVQQDALCKKVPTISIPTKPNRFYIFFL